MSRTAAMLRSMKVHNTLEVLKAFGIPGKDIAITHRAGKFKAAGRSRVWSPTFHTDPTNHKISDNKSKTFVGDHTVSMPAAREWAEQMYGISSWARCPIDANDLIPAYVIDRIRLAAARAAQEQEKTAA